MFFPNNICVTNRLRWHHIGVGYKEHLPLGDQTRIPPSHSPDLSHALPVTIWCTELVFETMKLFGLILGILGWLCLNIGNPQIGCLYLGAIPHLKKTPQLEWRELSLLFRYTYEYHVYHDLSSSCFSLAGSLRLRPRSPIPLLYQTPNLWERDIYENQCHISTFLALTPHHSDKPQILKMVWFVACWIIRPCIGHWNYPRIVVVEGSFIQSKSPQRNQTHSLVKIVSIEKNMVSVGFQLSCIIHQQENTLSRPRRGKGYECNPQSAPEIP